MKKFKRDYRFDGLKTIGLFAIIFAHVGMPRILFQLRNFDVPLMVLVSGSVFTLSSAKNLNYIKYVSHRIYRLLAPTWIFLTFFFLFSAIYTKINKLPSAFSTKTIISSYDLISGIGYVWIVRVFILIALILPLIFYLKNKMNGKKFLLIIFLMYLIYELLFLIYPSLNISKTGLTEDFFQKIIFFIIPFGCVAGLGVYLADLDKRRLTIFTIGFGLIFIGLFIHYYLKLNVFASTQFLKYPPRLYYLSYALFASFLLYLFSTTKIFKKIFDNKFILFVGSSSLWIYLWHIFFLHLWKLANINFNSSFGFLPKFAIVAALSIFTAYLQRLVAEWLRVMKPVYIIFQKKDPDTGCDGG